MTTTISLATTTKQTRRPTPRQQLNAALTAPRLSKSVRYRPHLRIPVQLPHPCITKLPLIYTQLHRLTIMAGHIPIMVGLRRLWVMVLVMAMITVLVMDIIEIMDMVTIRVTRALL